MDAMEALEDVTKFYLGPAPELPAGVHILSRESLATLAHAKARGDAVLARHLKPERLAAATIVDGPVTVATNGPDF